MNAPQQRAVLLLIQGIKTSHQSVAECYSRTLGTQTHNRSKALRTEEPSQLVLSYVLLKSTECHKMVFSSYLNNRRFQSS